MRIVYVLTSLGVGGTERQVIALAQRMAARGHAVSLLVLMPRQPADWLTDLEVVRLNMSKTPAGIFRGVTRGLRVVRAMSPDILHGHNFHGNMAGRLLGMLYPRAAVISTVHNVYEGGRLRMLAYRLTDRLTDLTTAVSSSAAERYIRLKAIPQAKCRVVTNGIDTAEFVPRPEHRVQTRMQMGAKDAFVWLAAGRIVPAKDFPNLLRAFAQVHAFFPAAQLWIAGEEAATGSKKATGFDAGGSFDQVRWLGLRRDMPALLDAADAFVLSSAWEGMPLALGEAMAMEKPVVATDVGGVRELTDDAGTIVAAKDSSALAEAMLTVMQSSPEARQSLGRSARQRICEFFSMDAKADEWELLYDSVN
jgi:glycosyltransferase involved in cell wall biosynthesis